MATLKKRINLSVSSELEETLTLLAKRDGVPNATKAVDLIKMALEIEEDIILASIAKARDAKDATFISHDDAWK